MSRLWQVLRQEAHKDASWSSALEKEERVSGLRDVFNDYSSGLASKIPLQRKEQNWNESNLSPVWKRIFWASSSEAHQKSSQWKSWQSRCPKGICSVWLMSEAHSWTEHEETPGFPQESFHQGFVCLNHMRHWVQVMPEHSNHLKSTKIIENHPLCN